MDHSLRDARPSDAAEIARLCAELGYSASPREIENRLSSLLAADNHCITVATESESRLLGWIAAEHRLLLEYGERVEIVGLIVSRDARAGGIGKALVSKVECWAASRGLSTVLVRSNIARSESHPFYRRIGYTRTKTQHTYVKIRDPV